MKNYWLDKKKETEVCLTVNHKILFDGKWATIEEFTQEINFPKIDLSNGDPGVTFVLLG